jgi:hypothetical protein
MADPRLARHLRPITDYQAPTKLPPPRVATTRHGTTAQSSKISTCQSDQQTLASRRHHNGRTIPQPGTANRRPRVNTTRQRRLCARRHRNGRFSSRARSIYTIFSLGVLERLTYTTAAFKPHRRPPTHRPNRSTHTCARRTAAASSVLAQQPTS